MAVVTSDWFFPKRRATAPADGARSSTIRMLRFLMAAALLLPLSLFLFASWIGYQDIHTLTDERIERSLDVLQEQAVRVFQSINLALVAVDEMLGNRSDEDIAREQTELHDRLRRIALELPEVQSIWSFDAAGHAQVTGTVAPAPTSTDYSQEDFFRIHQSGYAGTHIGEHHASQFGGQSFFTVSRAQRDAGGRLRRVIEVSVLPGSFTQFYSKLVNASNAQYAMIREDGLILTRHPQLAGGNARLDSRSGFGQTVAANPQGGFYTVASQVDRIERRFGVRRVPGLPVFVTAGIATSEVQSEWLTRMGAHLIFGIPATLLLFGALGDLLRRTRKLYSEQDRREAAEAAMRQSQKMEAVGQLTGGVAHDFNNLLMIVIGNLEMLQRMLAKGLSTDWLKFHRCIENAMRGARRGASLTQQLLAFSRRQPLNPQPVDVNKLVQSASDLLGRSLGEAVSFEVVGGAGLWTVEVDPSQMEAAIVNLAVNARDAMPTGGKLTIETSNSFLDEAYCRKHAEVPSGQYVLTCVTDTGTGMSQEIIDRAFEPFFTTKPPGSGTGLGLSQVYGFVLQSGGHLKLYSEPGHGTTVKLYLPRFMGRPVAEEKEAPLAASAGFGEQVLLVEDDNEVRTYVVEMLSELNYEVTEAANAELALEVFDGRRFDLLLTDVVLPGLNGRQLAEELKSRQSDLKVLFMTGYSRNAIVHQGRLEPGVVMVQKPVSANELAGKIREVLGAKMPGS